jgi:NitT/TauT family transport system substrate-binding protein
MQFLTRPFLLIVFLLLACASVQAQSLKKIKVTIPVPGLVFLPLYVGVEKGFFAKHGLDVEIISTSGDGPDVDALISGSVEFTVSTPNRLMTAYEQGKPLWGIMNLGNRMGIDCLINKDVATKLNISTATPIDQRVKALKGLTVAGTRPGAFSYLVLLGYAKRFGLEPQNDLQVIGVGGGNAMLLAVENNQVAVGCSGSPMVELGVQRGKTVKFTDNLTGEDPAYDDFLFEVMYVRPDYAKANPDVVRSMTAAMLESVSYTMDASEADYLPILRKYFSGTPDDLLLAGMRNTRQIFKRDARISDAEVNKASDFLIQTGALSKRPPPSAITTNQFLP